MRKYVFAATIVAASLAMAGCKQETVVPPADTVVTEPAAVATETVAIPVGGSTTTIVTPGATATVTATAPAMEASATPMATETVKP